MSGVVIFDTSCLKYLTDPATLDRVLGGLRAAHRTPWVSATNVVEVAVAQPAGRRERLIAVITRLNRDDRPILPFPHDILHYVGQALERSEGGIRLSEGFSERLLANPELAERVRDRLKASAEHTEGTIDAAFQKARGPLRKEIRQQGLKSEWPTLRDFLARAWLTDEMLEFLIPDLWLTLKLPLPALPPEWVMRSEPWRIFVRIVGAMAYYRGVVWEEPRPTHLMDAMQLVYLAADRNRLLVTADRPFLVFARELLHGQHHLARALHIDELIALN